MSQSTAFEATANVQPSAPNSNELALRIGDVILVAMPTADATAGLPPLLLSGVNQRTGARGSFRLEHVRAVAMPTVAHPPSVSRALSASSNESLRARAKHISTVGGSALRASNTNNNNNNNTVVGLEAFVRGDDLPVSTEESFPQQQPSSPKRPTAAVALNAATLPTPSSTSSTSSSQPPISPPLSPKRTTKILPPTPVVAAAVESAPTKKAPNNRQNRKSIMQRVSAVFTGKRESEQSRVKKLIKLVNKQFEQGKFADALGNLNDILASPASDNFRTRALFNIALCHAALKHFDEALTAVRNALAAGYDNFQNLEHPFFAPLQDNPEFFALLSEYLQKSDRTGAVFPIDQMTEYDTAPRLTGTMMHEMLVSPDVEYEPIPCMDGEADGEDDMDLANGDDHDELERADDDAGDAGDNGDDHYDEDDDERLIDRRKLPPTPSAAPAEPPLDQELPQPIPPASSDVMKQLSESANRLAAAGRAADARRVFQRMLELQPKCGAVYALWANLEAQVNDKYESCRLLKLAAQCGFTNWASIQRQEAFAPVLALPEFVEMIEEIRQAATVHSETRLD
jgi:tetratricopeptide (TPR) repeat protein